MKTILFALLLCSCAHAPPPKPEDVECSKQILCPPRSVPMYVREWGCQCITEIVEGKH